MKIEIVEVWKDIPEYEGVYYASTLGRIKSTKKTGKEKILKGCVNSHGYVTVNLSGKTKIVHQLVAIVFLNHEPCGFDLVVNHKNFIKTDNSASNLEIVTTRENTNKKHLKSVSKFTGVSWCKRNGKWISYISIKSIHKHLGYFDSEIEASTFYEKVLQSIKIGEDLEITQKRGKPDCVGTVRIKSTGKWKSQIQINGKYKYLGCFTSQKEANKAYWDYKNKLHEEIRA